MEGVDSESGLTPDEDEVMQYLMDAVNGFTQLPTQHPNDIEDFINSIHRCQDILAVRIARRHYPEGWPTYGADE